MRAGEIANEQTAVAVRPLRWPLCAVAMIATPPAKSRMAWRNSVSSQGIQAPPKATLRERYAP
jgi:hypothetical protein